MIKIPDVHFVPAPPGFPTRLKVCGESVNIRYSDNLASDRECYGVMIFEQRLIVLDVKCDKEHLAMTLTHEALHYILALSGTHDLAHDREENVVRSMTPFVHDLIGGKRFWV